MKQQQSKGALIVTIVLAVASVLVMLCMVVTTALSAQKTVDGQLTGEPVTTPEPVLSVQDALESTVTDVRMACFTDEEDGTMYANITGYIGEKGVWFYSTEKYPMTELDPITEIGCTEELYLLCAGGEITALDMETGDVVWCNREFGGASPAYDLDAEGNLYLTGYYGPDLYVIDRNGNTLCRVDQLDPQYYWPVAVRKADEKNVEVTFSMGPQEDGTYVVSYNMETKEVQLSQNSDAAWQQAYLNMLQSEEMQNFYGAALLRIDADEIPELYLTGDECDRLCAYNEQRGEVTVKTLTASCILDYKLGKGMFNETLYLEDRSVEKIYRLENGSFIHVGQVESVSETTEEGYPIYRYIWDGQEVDSGEHNERYKAAYGLGEVSYPDLFQTDEVAEMIRSWDDPSDDERIWKWRLSNVVELYPESQGFRLIDFDGNGVPELFFYAEAEYGAYSYIAVCDVKTQQVAMQYLSAYDVGYLADTGLVCDTWFLGGTSANDMLYQVGENGVALKQSGTRYTYDSNADYYLNDENVSEEEYFAAFGILTSDETLSPGDGCVSVEEIRKQLQ